jgi:hypothetical protein
MSDEFTKMMQAHIAKVENREVDRDVVAGEQAKAPEPDKPAVEPAAEPVQEATAAALPPDKADDSSGDPVKPVDNKPEPAAQNVSGVAEAAQSSAPAVPDISKLPPEFQEWYKAQLSKQTEQVTRLSNKVKTLAQTLNRREHEIADMRASGVSSGPRAAPSRHKTTAAESPVGTPPESATVSRSAVTDIFASSEWQAVKKDFPEMALLERAVSNIADQVASHKTVAQAPSADDGMAERIARLEERIEAARFREVETKHELSRHVGVTVNQKTGQIVLNADGDPMVEPRSREFAWFWYGLDPAIRRTVDWNDPAEIDALFNDMKAELGNRSPAPAQAAPETPTVPVSPPQNENLARAATPTMKPATIVRSSNANSAPVPFADSMRDWLIQRGFNTNL